MGFALFAPVVSARSSARSCAEGGHRVGIDGVASTDVACGLRARQIESALIDSTGCYPRFDPLGFTLCGIDGVTQAALPAPPPITASFIPFPQKRKDEMRAYSLRHYGINSYRLVDPHLIIWHYTDSTTYGSVYNTFSDDVPDVQFHELPQVCTHFVITTHGTIHQLVPLSLMCRQVVGLNYTSLGLENVGESDQQVLDDAGQYRAALRLTRWLRCRFHIPVRNVIGHNESLQSAYFRELVPAFRGQTHSDFNRHDMNIVRAAVARLGC
jgi:N-acetylmuramoyl-L-alanine amidase